MVHTFTRGTDAFEACTGGVHYYHTVLGDYFDTDHVATVDIESGSVTTLFVVGDPINTCTFPKWTWFYEATQEEHNSWLQDGKITITITPSANVDITTCAPEENVSYVTVEYF